MNPIDHWQTGIPLLIAFALFIVAFCALFINLADFAQYREKAERSTNRWGEHYDRNAKAQAKNVQMCKKAMLLAWVWPLVLLYYATRWIPSSFRAVRRELKAAKEWAS